MKYKDKRFLKFQERQRDGEFEYYANKTERRIRREREQRDDIFYQKFLLGRVDKFWWKHLTDGDKDSIIRSHSMQYDYFTTSKKDRHGYWYSSEVFDNWNDWFEHIKTTFETNKVKFREDKLKVLGI